MISFDAYLKSYLEANPISDESQLKSDTLFSEIKKAYVRENEKQSIDLSDAKLFSETELAKYDGIRSLVELESATPELNDVSGPIIDKIIDIEGNGYVPDDRGYSSKFGVRRNAYEAYLGQPATDKDIQNLTEDGARAFYQDLYKKNRAAEIKDPRVQAMVFDGIVNQGHQGMTNIIQGLLNETYKQDLATDGVFGSQTIDALNSIEDQEGLYNNTVNARKSTYEAADTFDVNGQGWFNRLQSWDDLVFGDDAPLVTQAVSIDEVTDTLSADDEFFPEGADVSDPGITGRARSFGEDKGQFPEPNELKIPFISDAEGSTGDGEEGFIESAARSVGGGLLKGISDIPRALGSVFGSDSLGDAADFIDGIIDAPEEDFAGSTTGQVFHALGQVVGLIGGGVIGGTAKVGAKVAGKIGAKEFAKSAAAQNLDRLLLPGASAASSGAVEQVQDYYNTVRERGEEVDRSTELTAMLGGAVIGSLDLLFPGRILNTGVLGKFTKRFNELTSGGRIKSAAGGFALEGATEAGQSLLMDAFGDALYDADPELATSINEAMHEGKIGGAVGAILGAILPKGIKKAGGAKVKKDVEDVVVEKNVDAEIAALEDDPADNVDLEAINGPELADGVQANVDVSTEKNRTAAEANKNETTVERITGVSQGLAEKNGNTIVESVPERAAIGELGEAYRTAQVEHETDTYQKEVFESYEQAQSELIADNDIKNYGDLLKKSVAAAKAEIDTILETMSIDVIFGQQYDSLDAVKKDVGVNNAVSVGVHEGGGLLGIFYDMDKGITYADALQAIQDSAGRMAAESGFGYTGDNLAYNQVHAMFSPLAQIAIASYGRGKIADKYTDPDNQKAFDALAGIDKAIAETKGPTPNLEKKRVKELRRLKRPEAAEFILAEKYTRSELPFQTVTGLSKNAEATSQIFSDATVKDPDTSMQEYAETALDSPQVGNAIVAGIDYLLPKKFSGANEPPFITKMKNWLQYTLFNAQNKDTKNILRDNMGELDEMGVKAHNMITGYKRAVKDFIGSAEATAYGKTKKEQTKAFDDLLDNLIRGEITFKRKDNTIPPSVGNSLVDDNGNYIIETGSNLVPDGVVPPKIAEVSLVFSQAVQKYREVFLQVLEFQQDQNFKALQTTLRSIDAQIAEVVTFIDQNGIENLNYAAFGKGGNKWLNRMLSEPYIVDDLRDQFLAMESAAIAKGDNTVSVASLENKFLKAAKNSKDINEFIKKTEGVFGTETLHPNIILALGGFESSSKRNQAMKNIHTEKNKKEQIDAQAAYYDKIAKNPYYVSRAYAAYENDTWVNGMLRPQTKEQKANKEAYVLEIAEQLAGDPALITGNDLEQAKILVDDYVKLIQGKVLYNASGGTLLDGGPRIGSAALKRGNISDAQRAFLGEYTDPTDVMEATLNRVGRLALNSMTNHLIYNNFIGRNGELGGGLYRRAEDAPIEIRRTLQPVVIPDEFQINVFRGMMATPEVVNTIKAFTESGISDGIWGVVQKMSGEFKLFNTIYSLGTASANIIAGTTGVVMTGGLSNVVRSNDVSMAKVYLDMMKLIKNGDHDGRLLEAIKAVGGSEVHLKDILRHQAVANDYFSRLLNGLATTPLLPEAGNRVGSKISGGWNTFSGIMHGVYRFGDLSPKVYGYLLNKEMIRSKIGLSEEQSGKLAKEIVRYTLFDYDQVPMAVKWLRDNTPLGGAFMSWMTLTYTTTYHSFRLAKKIAGLEMRAWGAKNIEGFDFNNPNHIARARKGFFNPAVFATSLTSTKLTGISAGLMMQNMIAYGIATAAGAMAGLFEDDDMPEDLYARKFKRQFQEDKDGMVEQMSMLLPEYYQNTVKSLLGVNERGNLEFINASRLANYGNFAEAVNAWRTDDPTISDAQAAANAVNVLFGDYFNTAFGLGFGIELLNNENKFGQIIVPPGASMDEQAVEMAKHLTSSIFYNSSFKTGYNYLTSLVSQDDFNEHTGEPINSMDAFMQLTGIKAIEFDPRKSLVSTAWRDVRDKTESRSYLTAQLRSFNKLSTGDITKEVNRAQETHNKVYDQLAARIQSAKFFGLEDDEITALLKKNIGPLSKKDIQLLLRGQKPAFALKKLGESKIASNALKGLSREARENFQYNYETARQLVNN